VSAAFRRSPKKLLRYEQISKEVSEGTSEDEIMGWIDPSTALKPRSEEQAKKSRPSISLGAVRLSNGSGSTLSMPRAGARGSRRVDFARMRIKLVT
jgi:hypothetical protein